MDIRNYIKDLLFLHDCVIIPGFGGFVTAHQSAEIHHFRNLVYPPSKTLMFNRRLQNNDGILISHIAQREKTEYRAAEEKVKQFALWWNRLLENKGVVNFPEVGRVYINSSNVLVFLPELRKNYLLDTFGLKPVAYHSQMEVVASKERKEKTAKPLTEEEYAEKIQHKRKIRTRLAIAAAIIGALLLMPQLFLQNILPEKIRIEQLNLLHVFRTDKVEPLPREAARTERDEINHRSHFSTRQAKEIIEMEPVPAPVEEEKVVESQNEIPPSAAGNYYIILGSYEYISDAIKIKKQLETEFGKRVEVFSRDDAYLAGIFAGSKEAAESSVPFFQNAGLTPLIMQRELPL